LAAGCIFAMIFTLSSPYVTLDASDYLAPGTTAVYPITFEEGREYWIVLDFDTDLVVDLDIVISSNEMDYEQFMMLPYYEDYMYAIEFSIAEGCTEGTEDFLVTGPYTGAVYLVIHDIGGTGGDYHFKVY